MPVFKSVRVDIHEGQVQAFIRPGGEVDELLWEIARDTREYGKAYVAAGHVRSGRLLRSIRANRPVPTGPLQAASKAYANARHAIYFHEGTTGPITGRPHLVVPKRRGVAHTNTAYSGAGAQLLGEYGKGKKDARGRKRQGKGVWRPDAVRGQRSKPFLRDGLRLAMAKHGFAMFY